MLPPSTYNKPQIKYSFLISLTIIIILFYNQDIKAQDIHFSQFYSTPLLTNPANTGMSGEDTRIAMNYRNQWSKIGTPYETVCSSIDKKLVIFNQCFGIGGLVLHDKSSAFDLQATEILLSLSYSRVINNQQLTIGLQPGYVSKSFNSENLTFPSQFDEINQYFNNTLPSQEDGMNEKINYLDINLGFSWRTMIRNLMPDAGISISHVNFPVEKFSTSTKGVRLPLRMTLNGEINTPLTSKVSITPLIFYNYTPGAHEFMLGSSGDYDMKSFKSQIKKLYGVAMLRINPARDIDALILGCGAKLSKFNLGISYDFNVSPLRSATNFNGAFEISIIYLTGKHGQEDANEPCYIMN
jgi:type IX secretion system PorP/SprF family membrane protein